MRPIGILAAVQFLIPMLLIVIGGELSAQALPDNVIPRADSVNVAVETNYVYDPKQRIYTYIYRLVNQHGSRQRISQVALETTGNSIATTAPLGWRFGKFIDRPLVHWYGGTMNPVSDFYIAPRQDALFTLTSPDPPVDSWLYVQGETEIPKLTPDTGELAELYPALFDVGLNSIRVRTVAPQAMTLIRIEIDPNTVSVSNWRDSLTVRAFGTDTVRVEKISWEKWSFGPSGGREMHETVHTADVNKDGQSDVELHFRIGSIGLRSGKESVCLTGYEADVGWRRGCATVTVGRK